MAAPEITPPGTDEFWQWPAVRGLCAISTIAWWGLSLVQFANGRLLLAGIHIVAGTITGVATLLATRRWGPAPLVISMALGAALLALTSLVVLTGGPSSRLLVFLGLVPLAAGLIPSRAGRITALLTSLAAMGLVGVLGPVVPASLRVELQPGPIEGFIAPVALGLLLFAFGSHWRRISQNQVLLLEQHTRKIEEQWKAVDDGRTELAAARDEALRASKTKSRFVAMTSHELRGPLNGILGMSHALRDTQLRRSQRDLVDALSTSAESLAKLLQDLLDLSKIEAGHLDIVPRPYEPRELVADVVDQYAHAASAKHIEIAASTAKDVPRALVGDAGRLRQILVNLVGNAIKFTHRGSVTLRARRDGEQVVFDVVDTGSGMSAEDTKRIFAPFEQVSAELVDRRAGTGLGLWISRSIADEMQGRLEVVSTPSRGTTFSVSLPLVQAEDPELPRFKPMPPLLVITASPVSAAALCAAATELDVEASAEVELERALAVSSQRAKAIIIDLDGEPGETAIPAVMQRFPRARLVLAASPQGIARAEALASAFQAGVLLKPPRATRLAAALTQAMGYSSTDQLQSVDGILSGTILIVDDDAINRKVARYAAEQLGLAVEEAESGEAALLALTERRPDLVLLDLHLEGLDGADVARIIVERWKPHERPTMVGYTGSTNEADRRRCLEAGMDDVLGKPLDPAAFSVAVTQALRQRSRRTNPGELEAVGAAVDGAVFAKLCRTVGSQLGAEILTEFLASLDGRFESLARASAARDRNKVVFAAHASASVMTTFGAQALGAALQQLESTASHAPWEALDRQLEAIVELREKSEATLRGLLQAASRTK